MAMWDPKLLIGQMLLCRVPPHKWHSCVITQTVPPRMEGDYDFPPAELIKALVCRYLNNTYGEISVKSLNDNEVVRPHPAMVSHSTTKAEDYVRLVYPGDISVKYSNDNEVVIKMMGTADIKMRARSRSRQWRLCSPQSSKPSGSRQCQVAEDND